MPKRSENLARGDYDALKPYISSLIEKEMKGNDVTGLSIALVDDQKVIWAEGFGYADAENKIPATPATVYRAGSVSKLFTATGVMQLVEQGKMNLDKPLQTYLPEFSIKSRFAENGAITPRTIMTHHAGLPSDLLQGMWSKKVEPFEKVAGRLKDTYISYPPNYVFAYSNVGVTLLGNAVEKVAGCDFAGHLDTAVLKPLGMVSSSFAQAMEQSPLVAKAYRKGALGEELPLRDVPAGGLNTTVLDLSRFMKMVFASGHVGDRQVIKPETLTEMLRPQNVDVPLDLSFRIGLGWMLSGPDIKNAGPVAHHAGATLYHRTHLMILPEHKLGVIVMANSATATRTVSKVATDTLKLALEIKTGIKQPEPEQKPSEKVPPSEVALQEYEGNYATFVGVVPVNKKSDYLSARIMGTGVRLIPGGDGRLGLQYKLLGLIPISLGDLDRTRFSRAVVVNREILKARMGEEELLVGERIPAIALPDAWRRRVGDYEVINRGDDAVLFDKVRVREEGGLLIVDYAMPLFLEGRMSSALMPISDTEAVIFGLGRGMGETIRIVAADGGEAFEYSGYLLKNKDISTK
jgi:CubicO group peptidase (beta-lactamase class C family)